MAEMTEEETLEYARHLWRRFGFLIVFLLAMVLSAIFGFTYTAALHDQTRAEAGKIYYALKSAVDEGDLEQAVGYYSQLSDEDFPAVRRLAAFSLAMGRYEEKQYESAIILLQDVLEKEEDPGLRELTVLRLSELYINAERFDDALKVLEENLSLQDGKMNILIYERMGDVYFVNNNQKRALKQYEKATLLAARHYPSYRLPLRIKISALLSLHSSDINDDNENAEKFSDKAVDDTTSSAQ